MKKPFFLFSILMILTLASCNLFTSGTNRGGIAEPDIEISKDSITVIPTPISSSPYITIIRYNVTSKASDATIKTDGNGNEMKYVVGQITPENSAIKGYGFVDNYIGSGSYFYQYAVRYKISNGYSYSKATQTCYLPTTTTDRYEQRVYSDATDKKMLWDTKAFTLKFAAEQIYLSDEATGRLVYLSSNGILNPEYRGAALDPKKNQRRLMIALSMNDGAMTRLFPLDLISEIDSNGDTHWFFYISLRDVLPLAYYDVNLTVEGFTLQEREIKYRTNYEDIDVKEVRQTHYHWTIPCTEYKVYESSKSEVIPLNIIAVTTNTSEDETYDYTEPAVYASARSAESAVSFPEESVEAPIELFRGFGNEDLPY